MQPTDRPSPAGAERSSWAYLVIFGLIFFAFWVVGIFILAVDPLNIYRWGYTPRLASDTYSPDAMPFLARAVARDPDIDTVLVGGSTSIAITQNLMAHFLPDARKPFNISYSGPRPNDRATIIDQLLSYSKLHHVIVAFDDLYGFQKYSMLEGFPTYLYDNSALNDLRMVNPLNAELALRVARGEVLSAPEWDFGDYRNLRVQRLRSFQTPQAMEHMAELVRRYRPGIDKPTSRTCADFPALVNQLIPAAQKASRRNISFDVVILPYSLAAYYEWQGEPGMTSELGASVMNNLLLARRCLVEGLRDMPKVRIFAFDDEDWITGDLANYDDPAHLSLDNSKIYEHMLRSIGTDTHRLTVDNIDRDIASLRMRISNYHVTNSKVRLKGDHAS